MDPFDRPPSRSSRRYSMNNSSISSSSFALPSLGGYSSRLPSPNDILSGSGSDRFASSLDLPPLRGIPRPNSPLLSMSGSSGSSSHRPGSGAGRSYSDFPGLPPLPPLQSSFSSSRNPNLPERTSGGRSFVQYPSDLSSLPPQRPSTRSRRTSLIGGGSSMDLDDLSLSSTSRPSFLSPGSSNSISGAGYANFPAPLSSTSFSSMDLPPFPPLPPLSSSSQRTTFNNAARGMADLSLDTSSPYSDHTTMQANLLDGPSGGLGGIQLSGSGSGTISQGQRNSASHTSKGIRKYSKRATFSTAQLGIMEELWAKDQYPSVDQVDECAHATGLTAKQIRTWFGNTRQARLAGTRTEARLAGLPGSSGGSRARHSMMPSSSSSAAANFLAGTSPPPGIGSTSYFPSPFPPPPPPPLSSSSTSSMFPPLDNPFLSLSSSSASGARPIPRSRRNSVVGLPSLYGSTTSSSSSGSSFGERGDGGGSYGP